MKSKKLKQMISTIVIATTVASTIPTAINPTAAFANSDITYSTQTEAETAGFRVQLINNDTEYEIAEYTGTNANVTIPSQIDGKSVTSIGVGAFDSRTGLTSVTIPSSVRSISLGAFYHCSGLRSVTIQNGVTSIGDRAFAYCSALTSIEIPSSVTSIDNNAFRYSGLTSIEIPNSVTSIGEMAFAQCPGLTSIAVPSSVTSIGSAAFIYVNDTATFYVPNVRIAELVKAYLTGTHMKIVINSDLGLETKTATTATVSFGAQTGATSVKLQQSTDGGNTWTNAATDALTASSTSATITGLTAGTNYKFRLVMNDNFYGNPLDVTTEAGAASASTVAAVAANSSPVAGEYNTITLTVKDSNGNIDTNFNGSKNVTISGCTAAPDGSYGIVNYNTEITQESTAINLNFSSGVATLKLRLTNAAAQNIVFNVDGVNTPNAAISITPVPDHAEIETLTQDITAPSSNGGMFVQQPIVTIKDIHGNICTNDNTTQIFASKWGRGEWNLTGTTRVTVNNGIASFSDLGATNEAAVIGAQLEFYLSDVGISSGTVDLPAPGTNEIRAVSVNQLNNINVDLGTDISSIGLPETVDVELSNGSTTSAAVRWDNGSPHYNEDASATYRFTGELELLDTILNPDNLKANVNVIVKSHTTTTTGAAVTYDLNYEAENGGTITGEKSQTINSGEDGSEVIAVPNSNYYFVKWSDGKTNARRKDINVMSNINVSAIFKANPSTGSSSSSSSSHHSSRSSKSTEQVTVNITDGSSDKLVSKTLIERTKASDGSKIDTVKYTDDKAKETIAALAKEGKDTARIVATDSDTSVSQTQISIPKDTLSELSSGKVNLEIQVNGAIVSVPKESVQSLAQSGQLNGDLYFRVVPIKDETKQEAIKTTADKEATVKAAAGNNGVQVLGTPMTIETNMGQRPVDIILPLTEINLPTDPAQRQAFLNDLGVFIEHSDGEKVLEKGTIVDYGNGVLGLKFRTNKFSDFTIVKLNQSAKSGWKLTNGSWYFINNNGAMETGWHKANSGEWTYDGKDTVDTWFHLGSDGKMDTGWFKDTDGSWYFLCNGTNYGALGVMETGWKYLDGKWYFLKDNGVMATGWQKSNGKWYYLYSDGSMASDTVVDGYTVGSDGAWIQQ